MLRSDRANSMHNSWAQCHGTLMLTKLIHIIDELMHAEVHIKGNACTPCSDPDHEVLAQLVTQLVN